MNVHVSLVAAREGELTNASIELGGKAGSSDVSLIARALGDPAKPAAAKIDVDGKVVGEKPQAFLVLLFPDLPLERIVAPAGSQGRLIVKLAGVPNSKITGTGRARDGADRGRLRRAGIAPAERARARRQGRRGQPRCQRRAHIARLRGAAERRQRPLEPQASISPSRPRPSILPESPAASPMSLWPARPISTSAVPRRASPFPAAPAAYRCRLCSACWWHGIARPRPRKCWARSAPVPRRSGRRAASRSARSSRPKDRSVSRPTRFRSAPPSRCKTPR